MKLTKQEIKLHKETAKKLKKGDQRKYKARIVNMYLKGDTKEGLKVFGWARKPVEIGQTELITGVEGVFLYKNCGRSKLEDKYINLSKDIEDLVKNDISADNKLQSTFKFCRMSAREVREKLIEFKGYNESDFQTRAISEVLNRLGYRLKKNLKNTPIKKIPETDEIFKNVHKRNKESDENPKSLRVSIDAKAKVNVGNFDRGGKDRRKTASKADDHDMNIETKLIPFGITEVCSGEVSFYYGKSKDEVPLEGKPLIS